MFTSTSDLYLPDGQPPAVGSIFRNRDLARTYADLARKGVDYLYEGRLGAEVVATVKNPPVAPASTRRVRSGLLERGDLRAYAALRRSPTAVAYRGLEVYGMAPSSSGGSTVGEALDILERFPLGRMSRTQALHHYLEASALAFADRKPRWGNVASYTLTIEQTGGSGIVVPGRGFLLNNELTDFNFVAAYPDGRDPNLPAPGKRPRSSQVPTTVLADGEPLLAVGSPGGSTIITTVLQILLERLDLGRSLPEAIAAPRASQRNTASVVAEPAFDTAALQALGHTFALTPGSPPEIGAAAGVEFLSGGRLLAAAEPVRRGGGSAGVVRPGR